jgi:hypothetical protein
MNAVTPIETARRGLENLLRRGADTSKARQALSEVERKELAEQARQDTAQAEVERAKREAIRQQADEEIAKLASSIRSECGELLPGFPVDVRIDRVKLEALLSALADRRENEERRTMYLEELAGLESRIAAIDSELSTLRAKAEPSDADLGRVHLLNLDKTDLERLMTEARDQLSGWTLPNVADLDRAWNQAARDARFGARHQIMRELESRLCRLAIEAREAYGLSNTTYRWKLPLLIRQNAQAGII